MFDDQQGPVDIFAEVDKPGAAPRPAVPVQERVIATAGPSRLLPILIVLVLLGAGGGGAYYFLAFSKKVPAQTKQPVQQQPAPNTEAPVNTQPPAPAAAPPSGAPVCGDGKCEGTETTATCPADCPPPAPTQPITPPEPSPAAALDSDGDGLPDALEAQLGTDPHSADTDHDGLSDRDEVMVYHTDPLNPDTDGDGFLDGAEVKAGYDPNGPGKLFSVPKK